MAGTGLGHDEKRFICERLERVENISCIFGQALTLCKSLHGARYSVAITAGALSFRPRICSGVWAWL
jgi:hypothetical protein